jgi:hypothetical protein
MPHSSPTLKHAGSVLPVRQDAACGGIGGPASLCTTLPPAQASLDESECWQFASAICEDCCGASELDHFHSLFQSDGIPYTVQHLPIVPLVDRDSDDGDSWYASALTPAQRNRALR